MPALEYGVGVWGCSKYDSVIWKQVETFWRYIAKCILGVPMRTPSGGVYGDLAWSPFWVRAAHQATAMWTRVSEMPASSIVRKAMYIQRDMLHKGKDCWLKRFKDTLHRASTCGIDKWNTWINSNDFNITCSRHEEYISGKFRVVRWEEDCLAAYENYAISEWYKDITRKEAKHGDGQNKLRTYALFKQEWGFESYLTCLDNRDHRVLLSKFRLGICPLRIETGRYEVTGRNSRGRPEHDRLCECCTLRKVEDEYHFLLQCPTYCTRRARLLQKVQEKLGLSDDILIEACNVKNSVFTSIMQCDDPSVINEVARYLWDAFNIRECTLLNR
jgi:hypothetical protein